MASVQTDSMPKTANLLACKQWWKVCFLHGNQEKYYRQIYGRAAAQRLAGYQNNNNNNNNNNHNKISTSLKLKKLNEECGIPHYKARQTTGLISNGMDTVKGQFPWLAAYYRREFNQNVFICGKFLLI